MLNYIKKNKKLFVLIFVFCFSKTVYAASIAGYANQALKFSVVFGAIMSVIMIVIGGFQYILAGGNEGTVTRAKSRIWSALLGLLLILTSVLILKTINPDLITLSF